MNSKKEQINKITNEKYVKAGKKGFEGVITQICNEAVPAATSVAVLAGEAFVEEISRKRNKALDNSNIKEEDKKKAVLIKELMKKSGISYDLMAESLDCGKQSFINKLNRDSFSINDLLIAAEIAGYRLILTNGKTGEDIYIDFAEFLKPLYQDDIERIRKIEKREKAKKKAEYDKLKKELEEMKNKYGFEE